MASGAREKTVVWNYSCIKVDVDLGGTTGHVIDRGRAISDLGGRIPFLGDRRPPDPNVNIPCLAILT